MTTVFFDRTVGKSLPQACKLLGLDVEAHRDHFKDDTFDEVWLPEGAPAAASRRGLGVPISIYSSLRW